MLTAKGGAAALSGGAAAVRGGTATVGAATAAYSVGSLGQSGTAGVASGIGGVARAAGSAAVSPLKRAASSASQSVKFSFTAGARAGFGATGGTSSMGTVGGASADPAAAPSRKMLAGVGAVALLGIGGALNYALQTRDGGPGGQELYSTENRPTADGLSGLPRDYTGPVLGPALPGDLGRPILDAQNRGQPVAPPVMTKLD